MSDLLVALGLVFVIEGVLYALFPGVMKRMLLALQDMPTDVMSKIGIGAAAFGLFIVWLVRG